MLISFKRLQARRSERPMTQVPRPLNEASSAPRLGRSHVVVVAGGSAGDMYPFLRIASALQRRGHHVTMLGPAAHQTLAAAVGVAYQALGTEAEYQAVLEDPALWNPRKGFSVLWRALRPYLSQVADFVADVPAHEQCLVLAHPLALPAASLARAGRADLRIVAAWLAPANLRSVFDPLTIGPLRIPPALPHSVRRWLWRQIDAKFIDPVALPDLNAARARYGLAPWHHFVVDLQKVADASVTLFPAWFSVTAPDWPQPLIEGDFQLYDPHTSATLTPELERFLAAGAAPLIFTPGSGNRQAARYFMRALGAVRRLRARAVFLTPHRAQVPAALPPTVLWMPYVPLRALLPHAAALVHHGGIGTLAEALRAGVPQLVVPLAYDQFDNGARLEALHAGRMLAGWRARPRALAAVLAQLITAPEIQAGCHAAAQRLARADPDRAIDIVEQLLPRG